jgi:hypothetical protein
VAGISAAYAFSHEGELDRDVIFQYAADLEGHPDNVAPAVYGGMTVSWTEDGQSEIVQGEVVNTGFRSVNYLVDAGVRASIFVPDYELSTAQARAALLNTVPFADAVFNVSRMGLLIGAMNPSALAGEQDPNELLFTATQDKLHQSYRAPLMKPSAELIDCCASTGMRPPYRVPAHALRAAQRRRLGRPEPDCHRPARIRPLACAPPQRGHAGCAGGAAVAPASFAFGTGKPLMVSPFTQGAIEFIESIT